jgi:hypothetical protein
VTDQHQNPTHQHSPNPPFPQQYANPAGQQRLNLGDMSGSTPLAGPGSRRPAIIAVVASFIALGAVVLGGFAVYDRFFKEDSGIAACKAMRDDRDTAMDSDGDGELSEEEYKAVREMFDDSRYEAIREHGKALVDLVSQMSKIPDNQGAGALVDQIADHATGLQMACADQGIVVNLMDN